MNVPSSILIRMLISRIPLYLCLAPSWSFDVARFVGMCPPRSEVEPCLPPRSVDAQLLTLSTVSTRSYVRTWSVHLRTHSVGPLRRNRPMSFRPVRPACVRPGPASHHFLSFSLFTPVRPPNCPFSSLLASPFALYVLENDLRVLRLLCMPAFLPTSLP